MRLQHKVAIVTGSAHGIGRATAERFAEEGARVAVADVDGDAARAVVDALGEPTRAIALPCDVSDPDSVRSMVSAVIETFGTIDVLVNNAGILRDARLVKMTPEEFDRVIDVNLKGVFNVTQSVAAHMVERGSGVILSASSVVGLYGNFGQTNYVAAKSAVIGMTKVWARELGPKGVRVNAVAPGFVQTRMLDSIPAKVTDRMLERVPLRRMGAARDIANAYLWLASDEAAYVHGHVLSVDGGVTV